MNHTKQHHYDEEWVTEIVGITLKTYCRKIYLGYW
jgi:hypothetical protein